MAVRHPHCQGNTDAGEITVYFKLFFSPHVWLQHNCHLPLCVLALHMLTHLFLSELCCFFVECPFYVVCHDPPRAQLLSMLHRNRKDVVTGVHLEEHAISSLLWSSSSERTGVLTQKVPGYSDPHSKRKERKTFTGVCESCLHQA